MLRSSRLEVEQLEPRNCPSGITTPPQTLVAVMPNVTKYNDDMNQLAVLTPSNASYNNWLSDLEAKQVFVANQMTPSQNTSVNGDLAAAQKQSYTNAGLLGQARANQFAAQQFLAAYNVATSADNRNYLATMFNQAVNAEADNLAQLASGINAVSGYDSAANAILQNFTPEQP